MNCYYCKGVDTVEEEAAPLCECEAYRPYLVEHVPTFVCRLCGDKSYSDETLSALEKITKGEASASSWQVIRVFDFNQLEGGNEQAVGGSVDHAADREFRNVPTVILHDKSAWWQPAIVRQIGWPTLDVQSNGRLIGTPPKRVSQSYRFSCFANIVNVEPFGSHWSMQVSRDYIPKPAIGAMYNAISTGEPA